MSKTIKLMILLMYSLSVTSVTAAAKEEKSKADSNHDSSMEKRTDKGHENEYSDGKRDYGKYKIYSGKESGKPRPNNDPGT